MTKDIQYYMDFPYKMEIIKDSVETGYIVSFPDLSGCLTCGATMEEAIANTEDAKKEWIHAYLEELMHN